MGFYAFFAACVAYVVVAPLLSARLSAKAVRVPSSNPNLPLVMQPFKMWSFIFSDAHRQIGDSVTTGMVWTLRGALSVIAFGWLLIGLVAVLLGAMA